MIEQYSNPYSVETMNDVLTTILQTWITRLFDVNRIELVCKRWLAISRQRLTIEPDYEKQKISPDRVELYPRLMICTAYIISRVPSIFKKEAKFNLWACGYEEMVLLWRQITLRQEFTIFVRGTSEDLAVIKHKYPVTEVEHIAKDSDIFNLCNSLSRCCYRFDTIKLITNHINSDLRLTGLIQADRLTVIAPNITEDGVSIFEQIEWSNRSTFVQLLIGKELAKIHEIAFRHFNEVNGHMTVIAPID